MKKNIKITLFNRKIGIKLLISIFILLSIISFIRAFPINFIAPTPSNEITQSATNVEINVSIVEQNLNEVKYNWNGTNYTMYNDSLVLMFNFDNRSSLGEQTSPVGNKTVDISRYSNNGTFMGNAIINLSGGRYDGGAQLDGSGDYVLIPYNASLEIPKITVSIWVKGTLGPADRTIISKFPSDRSWYFGTNNGILEVAISGDGVNWNLASGVGTKPINDSVWHHCAFTYNQSVAKVYVDGVLDESGGIAGSIYVMAAPIEIGSTLGGLYAINGIIDNVMIFNRSLSAAEIQQLYFTNLYKYNQTQWYLYVNQSKNSTTGLDNGIYTYSASAKDTAGIWNSTEIRTITIGTTEEATETEGDNAIELGITTSEIGGTATIYDSQQIAARNLADNQFSGVFDKMAVNGNKRWAFNYVSDGESSINGLFNLTPALYVLQLEDLTSEQITDQVGKLINST